MKALTRNTLLAIPLALVVSAAIPGQGAIGWDFLDAFTLAFCFTYVGHLVEVLLLKIPGIETPAGKFVRVLVDAPCSNTGVMRRRVDLRWRIRPEEIDRLRSTQLGLLKKAYAEGIQLTQQDKKDVQERIDALIDYCGKLAERDVSGYARSYLHLMSEQ